MKTLICLVLCALAAATYAAPAPSNMNQAEAQFWGSLLKGTLKLAPHIIRGIGGGVEVQDDDDTDDDDRANIEAFLSQSLQDRAEIEGKLLKKIAKGFLKVGPKAIRLLGHGAEGALNLLPQVINALGGGVEVQDDAGDDDLATIEALLSSVQNADDKVQVDSLLQSLQLQNKAKVENFLKTLGHIGKGILSIFGKKE